MIARADRPVTLPGGLRGDYRAAAGGAAVLMIHGFAGTREEAHDLFRREAEGLAELDVASLRFDLPGCGESPGRFEDATLALYLEAAAGARDWLAAQDDVDSARIGLLGYSLGSVVAALLSLRPPAPRALALWAPIAEPYDALMKLVGLRRVTRDDPDDIVFRWGDATLSLRPAFFKSLKAADPLAALAAYRGRLLVVTGDRDPLHPQAFVVAGAAEAAASRRTANMTGADHVFGMEDGSGLQRNYLILMTSGWFVEQLAGA